MSNQTYDDNLYNEEQKQRFLKNMESNTFIAYSRILKRAAYIEEQYGKDLYEFNLREIEQLMNFLAPKTFTSSQSAITIIQSYIRWAVGEDLRMDNINPLDAVSGNEYIRKFVDSSIKKLFTEDEINNITSRRINFQDSAIVQCLFEGIKGYEYTEILNILKNEVDRNSNILTVRNTDGNGTTTSRDIEISDKLMNMLYSAANEEMYIKGNGESNSKSQEISLISNNYIFRSAALKTVEFDRASSHLVLRRLKLMAISSGQPHLTATNIRNSGMLKMARDVYRDTGELNREGIQNIIKKFNLDITAAHRLQRDFLNIETIDNMYNEE